MVMCGPLIFCLPWAIAGRQQLSALDLCPVLQLVLALTLAPELQTEVLQVNRLRCRLRIWALQCLVPCADTRTLL